MKFFEPVLERIKERFPKYNADRIRDAYIFARDAHAGQKRFSGEPYIIHPVAVCDLLLDYNPDEEMILAALLHDVSEDTEKTLDDISEAFGPRVAYLVKGLEKLGKVRSRIHEPEVENLRRMFVHMAADLRIVVVKLCDRLHNMMTLEFVKPHKQERIARETLDVYVPIAARLGIYNLKKELEDYCFQFLQPDVFENLKSQLVRYNKMTEPVVEEIKRTLQKQLAIAGYEDVRVTARVKSVYSIYNKLKRKGKMSVDEIYDIFAMRVVLPDQKRYDHEYTGHLYGALGVIHGLWSPLQRRFKDYVALPKPNGYRSLHTTVVGLGPKSRNQPTEIQIRTHTMHEEAERGVASHWLYDETYGASAEMGPGAINRNNRLLNQLDWVKSLTNMQQEVENNDEFIDNLQSDIFNDRIFVLTPGGDVKDLPRGATPVDFAYAVHSEVGNKCVMAKVNGSVAPLDEELHNGNVVEIVTRESAEPSQYWLSFVKTSSAKSKIKSWFRHNADPLKSLREGREILNRSLERLSRPPLDTNLSLFKEYGGKRLTLKQREELVREVGRGMLLANVVIKNVFSQEELLLSKGRAAKMREKRKERRREDARLDLSKQIVVDGHLGLPVKIAACCGPTQYDQIVGYVTRGQGVTVHRRGCKVIRNPKEDRFIPVHWNNPLGRRYRVLLEVVMEDRIGLLSDISRLTSNLGVNITAIALSPGREREPLIFREFEIEIADYDQLTRLIDKLEEVPNVKLVKKLD